MLDEVLTSRRPRVQVAPPVILVIVLTALVSTGASMAGGLILYFQGLASLEETVRTTSRTEVDNVVGDIQGILDATVAVTEQQRAFLYNIERITTNDSQEWANLSRALSFGIVRSLVSTSTWCTGFVLVPWNVSDPSAMYSTVWAIQRKEGGREYSHAVYGEYQGAEHFEVDHNADPPALRKMLISVNLMDEITGEVGRWVRKVEMKSYLTEMLPLDYDPRKGGKPREHWELGHGLAVAHQWRPPRSWKASDGGVYTYSSYDSVYVPPPAPHPWSRYRAVLLLSMFQYEHWEKVIVRYKETHPETTVVVVDAVTRIIYSSTTGHRMVSESCTIAFSVARPMDCATTIANMSSMIREAFAVLVDASPDTFLKTSLDGTEYFVRKSNVHQDAFLIWMRPTSTVQGKVHEALMLLVVFTLLVLAFDVAISVLEIAFIAQPMRNLAKAILATGDMELEDAAAAIKQYRNAVVVVKEVRALMEGMTKTLHRLTAYRTFMPASLFVEDSDQSEETGCGTDIAKSPDVLSLPETSSKSSSAIGFVTKLDLHMQTKNVALLLVNVVGWWQISKETGLRAYEELATLVLTCVQERSGVLDSFSGDRFLVGWNTAKLQAEYTKAAANTALDLVGVLGSKYQVSCAVTSGSAKVGNAGTQQVRRFSILSPLVPWVMELELFGKTMGIPCCTDSSTAMRLGPLYVVRLVDAIYSRKLGSVVKVVRLMDHIMREEQEWMYELEEADKADELSKLINAVGEAVLVGNYDVAKHKVDSNPSLAIPPVFVKAIQARCFDPLNLCFIRCSDITADPAVPDSPHCSRKLED